MRHFLAAFLGLDPQMAADLLEQLLPAPAAHSSTPAGQTASLGQLGLMGLPEAPGPAGSLLQQLLRAAVQQVRAALHVVLRDVGSGRASCCWVWPSAVEYAATFSQLQQLATQQPQRPQPPRQSAQAAEECVPSTAMHTVNASQADVACGAPIEAGRTASPAATAVLQPVHGAAPVLAQAVCGTSQGGLVVADRDAAGTAAAGAGETLVRRVSTRANRGSRMNELVRWQMLGGSTNDDEDEDHSQWGRGRKVMDAAGCGGKRSRPKAVVKQRTSLLGTSTHGTSIPGAQTGCGHAGPSAGYAPGHTNGHIAAHTSASILCEEDGSASAPIQLDQDAELGTHGSPYVVKHMEECGVDDYAPARVSPPRKRLKTQLQQAACLSAAHTRIMGHGRADGGAGVSMDVASAVADTAVAAASVHVLPVSDGRGLNAAGQAAHAAEYPLQEQQPQQITIPPLSQQQLGRQQHEGHELQQAAVPKASRRSVKPAAARQGFQVNLIDAAVRAASKCLDELRRKARAPQVVRTEADVGRGELLALCVRLEALLASLPIAACSTGASSVLPCKDQTPAPSCI